jgi:hypothetical protein
VTAPKKTAETEKPAQGPYRDFAGIWAGCGRAAGHPASALQWRWSRGRRPSAVGFGLGGPPVEVGSCARPAIGACFEMRALKEDSAWVCSPNGAWVHSQGREPLVQR